MTVYVDELRTVPWPDGRTIQSCHMTADDDRQLEAVARQMGLLPGWRHDDHYDLTENKRRTALAYGAVETTERELVKLRKRLRERRDDE